MIQIYGLLDFVEGITIVRRGMAFFGRPALPYLLPYLPPTLPIAYLFFTLYIYMYILYSFIYLFLMKL